MNISITFLLITYADLERVKTTLFVIYARILKKALDKGHFNGFLSTDLSKAFDFSKQLLNLVNDYLCDRKQRTKIGRASSSWRKIIFG